VPDLLTGWTLIASGLAGWSRRPQGRSGALLVAAGFAWFAPNFAVTGVTALGWLSAHALYLHRGPLVHLVLTYPRGRLVRRLDVTAVAVGYAAAAVTPVWGSETATIVLAALLVAVAIRGYARAAGRERRIRLAALQATTLLAAVLAAIALVRLAAPGQAADAATLHAYQAALCGLSLGLLVGLFRGSWERAEVADLVVELGETRSGTLRDELARALGDPSLQVGYWVLESAGFVDSEGRPLRVPDPGSERSMTMVEQDGQPLAVLVHDPAVLGDPGLGRGRFIGGQAGGGQRAAAGRGARPAGRGARPAGRGARSAGPRSASRAGASWRRAMWSAAVWSAGCATGRCAGSRRWRRSCVGPGVRLPEARTGASPGRGPRWRGRRRSGGGSLAGSIPVSCPGAGSRPCSARWPGTSRCRSSWRYR
jgi:hypothetical protein